MVKSSGEDFVPDWARMFVRDKFGSATTHWDKLEQMEEMMVNCWAMRTSRNSEKQRRFLLDELHEGRLRKDGDGTTVRISAVSEIFGRTAIHFRMLRMRPVGTGGWETAQGMITCRSTTLSRF